MKNILFVFLLQIQAWFFSSAFAQTDLKSSLTRGKIIYEQNCLTCHQMDGSGVPNLNPPLVKTSAVSGNHQDLIKIVLNGMQGKEIEGESYSNAMPSFEYVLTDQQIADVLTYIRNNFGNKYPAVNAAQVKVLRGKK